MGLSLSASAGKATPTTTPRKAAVDEESPLVPDGGSKKPTAFNASAPRNVELDVLRGAMALLVVSHHFHWLFEKFDCQGFVYGCTCSVLFHGKFSVMVFYVLSGVVLLKRFLVTKKINDLTVSIFKRIPRLVVPVFGATFTSCLLANIGAYDQLERLPSITHSKWCGSLVQGYCWTKDWSTAFMNAMPPFTSAKGGHFPAGVLWTLQYELIGSIYLFLVTPMLLYVVDGNLSWPSAKNEPMSRHTQLSLVARCAGVHLALLAFWVLMTSWERQSPLLFEPLLGWMHVDRDTYSYGQLPRAIFLFQVGITLEHSRGIFNSLPLRNGGHIKLWPYAISTTRYSLFALFMFVGFSTMIFIPRPILSLIEAGIINDEDYVTFGAIITVLAVLVMPYDFDTCCVRSRIIGDISFGVYLFHGITLFAIGSPTYMWLRDHGSGPVWGYFGTLAVCVPILACWSALFYRGWEKPFAIDAPRSVYGRIPWAYIWEGEWCGELLNRCHVGATYCWNAVSYAALQVEAAWRDMMGME